MCLESFCAQEPLGGFAPVLPSLPWAAGDASHQSLTTSRPRLGTLPQVFNSEFQHVLDTMRNALFMAGTC